MTFKLIFPFDIVMGAVTVLPTTCSDPDEINKLLATDMNTVFVEVFRLIVLVLLSVLFSFEPCLFY